MKLFFSPMSPYVRKVMALAHEKGVATQIELLDSAASPVKRDMRIVTHNPLGKVPCLITDGGESIYDSRVIAAYIDALPPSTSLNPASGPALIRSLVLEALADGVLDACLLLRYENAVRPENLRWADWSRGQMDKVDSGLAELEAHWLTTLSGPVTIGVIATGCMLGYLDLRFADKDWRSAHPGLKAWFAGFSERPSMQATKPPPPA